MVSSRAKRGVRRTMGCGGIGVTLALEPDGKRLREGFDVLAECVEGAEAPGNVSERIGPRGNMKVSRGGVEAEAGDLAGAHADGEADDGFIVVDDRFDVGAGGIIAFQMLQRLAVDDLLHQRRDGMTCAFHGLLNRITWEEAAQEGEEPGHERQYAAASDPGRIRWSFIQQIAEAAP